MNKFLSKFQSRRGFTLIELLVVIAIIAGLAVVVFVALNPGARVKAARDARRQSDVDTILTAIHTYVVDNGGDLPTGITTTDQQIGATGSTCALAAVGGCTTAAACYNLAGVTDMDKYLKSNPVDPTGGTTWDSTKTGYVVSADANNIVTVKACGYEGDTAISASR